MPIAVDQDILDLGAPARRRLTAAARAVRARFKAFYYPATAPWIRR
jgi:hypothetical protein